MNGKFKCTAISIILILLSFNTCFAQEKYVYPIGEAAGVRLYTDGLLVTQVGEVRDDNGHTSSPGEECGLRKGDVITRANNTLLTDSADLMNAAQKDGSIELCVQRGDEEFNVNISPVLSQGIKRLGLWLRDSTAGVGTVTYVDSSNGAFGALGHGICDVDTGTRMRIRNGTVSFCRISTIRKSARGAVGELECDFTCENYGILLNNTDYGIYGKITDMSVLDGKSAMRVGEPYVGDAAVMTNAGDDTRLYFAKIIKVYDKENSPKELIIEITDERLKEKTGGIVQGMSGAPIIQDNSFVGAVTHVFVNSPCRGYGVRAESMLRFSDMIPADTPDIEALD